MGKNPAFQFYPKDWLCDPHLKMATWTTKGIWIELICYMWQNKTKGRIQGTITEITESSLILEFYDSIQAISLDSIKNIREIRNGRAKT